MAVFVIHWENCLLRYIHRECAAREREREFFRSVKQCKNITLLYIVYCDEVVCSLMYAITEKSYS